MPHERLLDAILSHKKEHVETFLRNRDLPHSYTKKTLHSKLEEGLKEGKFSDTDLIDLLDAIEEYGNQHIYLYNCSSEYLKVLKDPAYIQRKLNENNLGNVYNNKNRIFIPSEPELSYVFHDSKTLKFKWIDKRVWKFPFEERIENDKLYKIIQMKITRGVTTFRVDLISGASELMIQKLPSGTDYEDIKDDYLFKLSNFIDTYPFDMLKLRKVIKSAETSDEVEKRQINFDTIAGGKIAFKSRGKGNDYTSDPNLSDARNALGQDISGSLGNFYWKPNGILVRPIHTHIYDDRMAIFGQCVEREVNYVLSRIRFFASI